MQTKTLTIQLNNEQLPILPVEPEAYLSFATHADGNELELTGNRVGLLLLAKAALGMAEPYQIQSSVGKRSKKQRGKAAGDPPVYV